MTLKINFFFERMPLIQRKHFMLSEPTKSIKNLLTSCLRKTGPQRGGMYIADVVKPTLKPQLL